MTKTADTARRLLERTGEHPVISLYFDLDPEEFATAPARATQARSLVDEAERMSKSDDSLDHQDRTALEQDLERLDTYLQSDELPVSGARALAIFCSNQDQLFDTVQLSKPAASRVEIARTPYLEPLVAGHDPGRWGTALVSRRNARIFDGDDSQVRQRREIDDNVPGRTRRGPPNSERSVDHEADAHLRNVAAELHREWRQEPFQTLFVGGPNEVVARFTELLHNDLRPALWSDRLDLDASTTTEPEVHAAVVPLLEQERANFERAALEALSAAVATNGRAATGIEAVTEALTERRVQTLLLSPDFQASGGRCPTCGLLSTGREGSCPADGTELLPVPDLREAAVHAALLQDAEVLVVEEPTAELRRGRGIAGLLRF